MKSKLLLIAILQLLLWSCKSSSVSKQDLITENKVLKERLAQLNTINTDSLAAVVEVSNMNVVYRGVFNPIRITLPNAVKTEASAPGLKKVDDYGNYTFVPHSGKTVDINVLGIMPNNDTIHETKRLRIKSIGKFLGTVNGFGCGNKCEVLLTKEELKKAKIEIKLYDLLFDWAYEVPRFKIKFPDKMSISVEGNRITNRLEEHIESLKIGDKVLIFDIKVNLKTEALIKPPTPVLIRIVEG